MRAAPPPVIESVEVLGDRVVALVRCEPSCMRTSQVPGLSERAMRRLPGLSRHGCDNDEGHPIADELGDTELPHLLEHVAVELLRLAAPHPANAGETEWDFARDGAGAFRVTLRHPDDLACLAALKAAADLVASWAGAEEGDVAAALTSVREARAR